MAMHSTDKLGIVAVILVIAVVVAIVWGILAWEDRNTDTADSAGNNYETVCIEGVAYLIARDGYKGFMSVKFNRDGKIVLCDG